MALDSTRLLFVYGTLRRDCPSGAHQEYLGGAQFIATGRTRARLYRVSYYPALVPCSEPHWVTGDLFQLPDVASLARIDRYECASPSDPLPHEYQRQQLMIELADGGSISAWCYIYQHSIEHLPLIASGDFLNT
jgi:gamma-glutamylcyclotransferase (GGCT)/AIG2-like uncharacterized protein YtfP